MSADVAPPRGPFTVRICAGCGLQINDGHHSHDRRLAPAYEVAAVLASESVPAEAMAAEARIIEAQTFDVKALGKGRRRILTEQVRRMYRASLGEGPPRTYGRNWRQQTQLRLLELGESDTA